MPVLSVTLRQVQALAPTTGKKVTTDQPDRHYRDIWLQIFHQGAVAESTPPF
jgi:hypothetical protein